MTRRHTLYGVLGGLALVALSIALACTQPVASPAQARVYFSPHGGATTAILQAMNQATSSILVQAYTFTSMPIAKALVEASKRPGMKIEVILDKSNLTEKYSAATFLSHAGIPLLIDDKHAIAHNKIMVIDNSTIITGSFNFTRAAEDTNAENLLVLTQSPALVQAYVANFRAHAAHSAPYGR